MLKRFLAFAMTVAVLLGAGALASCNSDVNAPKPVVAQKLGTAYTTMLVNCPGDWWENGDGDWYCSEGAEWCIESEYLMGTCEFEFEYFIMSACDAYGGEWCNGGEDDGEDDPPQGPPHVSIICTPLGGTGTQVVRDQAVDCRVSDPQDSLAAWNPTYVSWQFVPPAGYGWGLGTVTESNPEPHFIGKVGIGGNVTVQLRLQQGTTDTTVQATTSFSVTARSVDSFPVRNADQLHASPPYQVVDDYPNPNHKDTLGRASHPPSGPANVYPVPTGPNKGYRYYVSYELTHVAFVTIPLSQFQDGGYYYTRAPGSVDGNWCTKAFVQNSLAGYIAIHEGVNREAQSHTRAAYDYLSANATAIRDRTEALVFNSATVSFNQRYEHIVGFGSFKTATDVPDNDPNYGTYGPNGCSLKLQ
jgi:hypothetical protein